MGGFKWVVGVSEEVKVLNTIVENQSDIDKLIDGSNDKPTDKHGQTDEQTQTDRQAYSPIRLNATNESKKT